jgi:Caspase domain
MRGKTWSDGGDSGNMMRNFLRLSLFWLVGCLALTLGPRPGAAAEQRFALVVGNSQYKTGTLATPANDAGLVADALQAAGFTVTGARDLDQATLRESFREFISQVSAAGPDAVALIYLAGYGVQYAGDNFFVPVDADIAHDVDVPLQAIRISDFTQPLASLPGRVKIVILDAARQNPFAQGGQPLAGGLALVDPPPSLAFAFNAAPGTVAPDEQGPYGAYATALTEMIGTGGLSLDDIFARLRLRVSEQTQGAQVPWYASQIDGPFFMTERAADAPPPANVESIAQYRSRPMRDFGNPDDAYAAALALDTIDGYEQFLAIYPNSPYAQRIAAMIAVRREEIAWRHCVENDTPPAYWSYLRRYPNGPHIWDARRRLAFLRAEMEPPPGFAMIDFGVPPPPPDEMVYLDRPVIMFGRLGFAPPPPPPVLFLPPRPHEFAVLPPPPPPRERFALPIPAAAPIAAFIRPPQTVAVRPAPAGAPTGPGGRPEFRVSLPAAAARAATGAPVAPGAPGTPGAHPGPGAPAATLPPGAAGAPIRPGAGTPPPGTAFVKPEGPPPHPAPAAPAFEKPAPPPPHPSGPAPAVEKPAPPPPHPAPAMVRPTPPPPPPHPAPAAVRPSPPPPPHPAPPPPHPAPAAARPAPPPPAPHPGPPPKCPPGKTATPSGCK